MRPGVLLFLLMLLGGPAWGWGSAGHRETGAIADALIRGTPAAAQVRRILGGGTLAASAVWADCAKSVRTDETARYEPDRDPACRVFDATPQGVEEMVDFARRNPGHRRWHYTDIPIQEDRYDPRFVGARADDVVHALEAAIARLRQEPVPAPFHFAAGQAGEREALRLLAHLVGDLHQPLHVGAIYLSPGGRALNPDRTGYDPDTSTVGGNLLVFGGDGQLHALWDEAPRAAPRRTILTATGGPMTTWPARWATDTLQAAQAAFAPLRFGPRSGKTWPLVFADSQAYDRLRARIQARQLALAGQRMADLLKAIWPR